jgi:tetratricopeptide (TPR) repeat protein
MTDARLSSLMARAAILFKDGQFQEALPCLHEAVVLARSSCGEHSKECAKALDFRSKVHRKLGNQLESERDLHESVTIFLGRIRKKGRNLSAEHKYQEAEALYREALQVCIKTFGPRHRETATCLDNLGSNLRCQSRFQDALLQSREALDIRSDVLGEEHTHTAASLCNVGYLYRLLGRHDEALPMLVKSLQIRERLLHGDHPSVAESLDRIASVFRDQGRFDEALPLCERALHIRESSLGPDHPLTAASKNNKALILERRRDDAAGDAGLVTSAKKQPASGTADAVVENGQISVTRENHAAGYAIVAVVVSGVVTASVLFWFLPWLAVAVGLAVIAFTAISFITSVSFESLVLRTIGRARAAKARSQMPDRDAVVLGNGTARGTEVKPPSSSSVLTADGARELPDKASSDTLDLHWVRSMTPAAADELATRRCGLCINALQDLPSKLAKAIRVHRGSLELKSVAKLTVPAAAAIARHEGSSLRLGLTEMLVAVAEHLAHHRGSLILTDLRAIDEDAAKWIVKHRGPVNLTGLRLVSKQALRILRTSPHIELPEDLGEGI